MKRRVKAGEAWRNDGGGLRAFKRFAMDAHAGNGWRWKDSVKIGGWNEESKAK